MTKFSAARRPAFYAIFAFAILVGLQGLPSFGATVAVGNCVTASGHYPTIQSAVNAVPAGSTIKVCPGNYAEQVVINKKLTLNGVESGASDNPTVVIPATGFVSNTTSLTSGYPIAAQILVESPATAVTLNSITVDGSGSNLNDGSCNDPRLVGIYFQNASGTINNAAARNQAQNAANFGCQNSAGLGIFVQSESPGTSTVTIENSAVRGYQKSGIIANETGTVITITGNSVIGVGPVDTGQNSVQVGFGATGRVQNNFVADDIFNGDPSLGMAAGILIFDAGDMTINGNSVATTQIGIAVVTDGSFPANGNTVNNNQIANTELGDGIDLCSNDNIADGNSIFSSGQSGIHLDSSCGATGSSNSLARNAVNEACAGILTGSGTGNSIANSNNYFNVENTTLSGDACTPTVVANALVRSNAASASHRLSPARP